MNRVVGDRQHAAPDAPRSSLCERGAHGGSGLLRRRNHLHHWPPNLPDGAQIYAPAEGRGGSDCTLGKECRMIGIAKRTDCHCETETLRSEEHTSELQSLMRISYAVFCL